MKYLQILDRIVQQDKSELNLTEQIRIATPFLNKLGFSDIVALLHESKNPKFDINLFKSQLINKPNGSCFRLKVQMLDFDDIPVEGKVNTYNFKLENIDEVICSFYNDANFPNGAIINPLTQEDLILGCEWITDDE